MKPPFIKTFKTPKKPYIYDVNTNQILAVDEIIHTVVDDYFALPGDEYAIKYGPQWEATALHQADASFREAVQNGLFSRHRPSAMQYRMDAQRIHHELNTSLGQILLDVTEECNMRCRYCTYSGHYFHVRTHRGNFMNQETARRALDFYFIHSGNTNELTISFYGGEPLLNFPLIQYCVEYARSLYPSHRLVFSITTNGTLLNPTIIRFLIENEFRTSISLDGPASVHDQYRVFANSQGTFRRVYENLEQFKATDAEYFNKLVSFSAVTAPPYDLVPVNDFFSTTPLLENTLFPSNLRLGFVNILDSDISTVFGKEGSKAKESIRYLWNIYEDHVVQGRPFDRRIWVAKALFDNDLMTIHNRAMTPLSDTIGPNGICLPGRRKFFVNHEGKFFMCERVGYHFPIGDLENGFDLEKINQIIAEYIDLSHSECYDCWAVRLCSNCFLSAQKGENLDGARKKEQCDIIRQRTEWFLTSYCHVLEQNPRAFDFMREKRDTPFDKVGTREPD